MKILCTYKPIDEPWGGANNFLRALYGELIKLGATITFDSKDTFDLIFMNQLSSGRGQDIGTYTLNEVNNIKSRNPGAPLIVRCVNLRRHSHPSLLYRLSKDFKKDRNILSHVGLADHIIYQSKYQYDFFKDMGAENPAYSIIHNGASNDFLLPNPKTDLNESQTLKIVSSSFARRATKKHDLIARLSELSNVEVRHIGAWPDYIDKKGVNCLGVIEHRAMMDILRESHYFVHPAIKDPCPNSMIEALCAGVPVLYNPGIGSGRELGEEHGIAMDLNNLQDTVAAARRLYNELVGDLAEERTQYSIQAAAEKYWGCFNAILND